ncbi:acyl-coenzyme A diphosphatase FITM2-like [Planococcus citri]|uniref:acyl-coenzyme A diphosphatase FITM2-like n=1 Tax=Planococcus citri TaxID=170843 RepID=UPI0031F89318
MNWMLEKLHSFLLKYVIYGNINGKATVYVPVTIVLSLLCEFYPLPDSYLNYKDNVLNRGFMKPNYIYSSLVLLPFAVIISYTYSKGNVMSVFKNVTRTTLVILACQVIRRVQLLYDLEDNYDHCSRYGSVYKTEQICTSRGYEWITFQLSGHTFYMFYYSLATMEEMRLYRIWQMYVDGIHQVERLKKPLASVTVFRYFTEAEYSKIKGMVSSWNNVVRFWMVIAGIYIILLDFCTLTTMVYFHQIEEKVIGSLLAIGLWYILYKFLFSEFILEQIKLSCNYDTRSLQEKYLRDWYVLEARKTYYFKKINCSSPFLQPNFDI